MLNSALYQGVVSHRRFKPVDHLLNYKMFYFLIDLDELGKLEKNIAFFSIDKPNLISFHHKDYGENNPPDIKEYVLNKLKSEGVEAEVSRISMLCLPRIFGYAFNPITTYYCYSQSNHLVAIVYEVSNTFGERHSYVFEINNRTNEKFLKHSCDKEFYVSPFMPMDCRYKFTVLPPSQDVSLAIRQFHLDEPILNASFMGSRYSLTSKSLATALLKFPFNGLKVIIGIHWEALKLWIKGLKIVARPKKVTVQNTQEK
ncbi:MAG: DUF1365 domain-containing protein [Sneathiella sp.]|uniref:DUF1365 domain-containing protein n=1 Tax=Sneathiella sp. TaxID=1964365 RepID=UPI003003953C